MEGRYELPLYSTGLVPPEVLSGEMEAYKLRCAGHADDVKSHPDP